MKRLTAISLGILMVMCLATDATAGNDVYKRKGTKAEKHADSIFTGVFGQCRQDVGKEASGVVAIIFSVGESGKFGATATLKEDEGKSILQALARCMGDRANQARYFPRGEKTIVGVKYEVKPGEKVLMLGSGETDTLQDGDVFRWARQDPPTPVT